MAISSGADICLVELGGTVGDMESAPFLEAARQLHMEMGDRRVIFIHTTLIPIMGAVGEQKTKPTQHSVKELRSIGIQPDIIIGRCPEPLKMATKEKISLFCNVSPKAIFTAHDVSTVYSVPILLHEQGMTNHVLQRFDLAGKTTELGAWADFVNQIEKPKESINVALVGKYTGLKDSYISHYKAFEHSGARAGVNVDVAWIDSPERGPGFQEDVERMKEELKSAHALLVPGGFGVRGTEGKIEAIRFARENNMPFLGICLGFQLAVAEFARNVMGLEGASSTEFDKDTLYPVVDILPEQLRVTQMGASMRLGAQKCIISEGSRARELYSSNEIYERHRHRYEVNPDFISSMEKAELRFSGISEDGIKMEIGELDGARYHIGCQFHPEFLSRPEKPAPLFLGLIEAAKEYKNREI